MGIIEIKDDMARFARSNRPYREFISRYFGIDIMETSQTFVRFGTAFMISSQVVMNIGMCLKMLPCIGITLPFISAGGSANICIYLAIGLVMSVDRINRNDGLSALGYNSIITPFTE